MKVAYYPGCTLKTSAKNLNDSAVASLARLDLELEELPRWNCCGAVYSLADDDLLHLVAPIRDLIRVADMGHDKVVTICSMCYNTLARANNLIRDDEEKRFTINSFMEEETDYTGQVEVIHLLPFLRDHVGWDKLKEKVTNPLKDLKVSPYYGCTLTRPKDIAIDSADNPTILHDFLDALGAQVIDSPASIECCGSYQILSNPEAAYKNVYKIVSTAQKRGAEALVSSCPLCEYSLGHRQKDSIDKFGQGESTVPTFYFTQLLAIALGVDEKECHFDIGHESSRELLSGKNLISA
ncbi:MAG: heterodisulfide reductase, subunit B [candidate division Zixibacteria bacterium]|nr:heterodisulfide reductase, subunit B [candidate division Zixibacteria bacterium]